VEAASEERAVLVAVNNPIARYVLERTAEPFTVQDLQSALAQLSTAPKDGGRLEPFVLDLYRTQCSRCGEWISADYFVWDKEEGEPVLKFYSCPHCSHTIEEATNEADLLRAHEYEGSGLQHAMALEQLAPQGSPERNLAEEALGVYPSRAVYAIVTLLNKLDQLEADEAVRALLLTALDQANALWGHPEGRSRPLQLSASARFLENNVWRALEATAGHWALPNPNVGLKEWTDWNSLDRSSRFLPSFLDPTRPSGPCRHSGRPGYGGARSLSRSVPLCTGGDTTGRGTPQPFVRHCEP
jgi:hypothetical protein